MPTTTPRTSVYARLNQAQSAPFSRLKLGALIAHLPELMVLALGLLLTLALLPVSQQSSYALKPLGDLIAYLLGISGAPTQDELLAELNTQVALTQMALCAAIGMAAGSVLAYGRALRALWQHRTMTMLDELLGSKLLARIFKCSGIITFILGALAHSYLALSCPFIFLSGFTWGYSVIYRITAKSRT